MYELSSVQIDSTFYELSSLPNIVLSMSQYYYQFSVTLYIYVEGKKFRKKVQQPFFTASRKLNVIIMTYVIVLLCIITAYQQLKYFTMAGVYRFLTMLYEEIWGLLLRLCNNTYHHFGTSVYLGSIHRLYRFYCHVLCAFCNLKGFLLQNLCLKIKCTISF